MDTEETLADEKLYGSFLQGDTTAYDALLLRHGNSLTRYLFGYLHDWQESEDMMIEAFARIMVKKPSIRDGVFKAYLFRTARNLTINYLRKKKTLQEFSIDGLEQETAENILAEGTGMDVGISAGSSTVEEEYQKKEREEVLHMCLDRIEPDLREALWLIYFEDMSYAQAASVMGVNEKRISRLLTRGKQEIKKELVKEGITNAYG